MISILIRVNFQINIESEIYVIESTKKVLFKITIFWTWIWQYFIEEVGLST